MPGFFDFFNNPSVQQAAMGIAAAGAGYTDPAKGALMAQKAQEIGKLAKFRELVNQMGFNPDNPLSWNFDVLGAATKMGLLKPQEAIMLGAQLYEKQLKGKELDVTKDYYNRKLGIEQGRLGLEREKFEHQKDMDIKKLALYSKEVQGKMQEQGYKPADIRNAMAKGLEVLNAPFKSIMQSQVVTGEVVERYTKLQAEGTKIFLDLMYEDPNPANVVQYAREALETLSKRVAIRQLAQDPSQGKWFKDSAGKKRLFVQTDLGPVSFSEQDAQSIGIPGPSEGRPQQEAKKKKEPKESKGFWDRYMDGLRGMAPTGNPLIGE